MERTNIMNEFLLIGSLLVVFALVLIFFHLFGKTGLYCWTAFATITANIEVLIVVNAFGMEQTLGNILFASRLSEIYGGANLLVFARRKRF